MHSTDAASAKVSALQEDADIIDTSSQTLNNGHGVWILYQFLDGSGHFRVLTKAKQWSVVGGLWSHPPKDNTHCQRVKSLNAASRSSVQHLTTKSD